MDSQLWIVFIGVLACLLMQGFQLVSRVIEALAVWYKRLLTLALSWAISLMLSVMGVILPGDPRTPQGAGYYMVAGSLIAFGAHELLFGKKKIVPPPVT